MDSEAERAQGLLEGNGDDEHAPFDQAGSGFSPRQCQSEALSKALSPHTQALSMSHGLQAQDLSHQDMSHQDQAERMDTADQHAQIELPLQVPASSQQQLDRQLPQMKQCAPAESTGEEMQELPVLQEESADADLAMGQTPTQIKVDRVDQPTASQAQADQLPRGSGGDGNNETPTQAPANDRNHDQSMLPFPKVTDIPDLDEDGMDEDMDIGGGEVMPPSTAALPQGPLARLAILRRNLVTPATHSRPASAQRKRSINSIVRSGSIGNVSGGAGSMPGAGQRPSSDQQHPWLKGYQLQSRYEDIVSGLEVHSTTGLGLHSVVGCMPHGSGLAPALVLPHARAMGPRMQSLQRVGPTGAEAAADFGGSLLGPTLPTSSTSGPIMAPIPDRPLRPTEGMLRSMNRQPTVGAASASMQSPARVDRSPRKRAKWGHGCTHPGSPTHQEAPPRGDSLQHVFDSDIEDDPAAVGGNLDRPMLVGKTPTEGIGQAPMREVADRPSMLVGPMGGLQKKLQQMIYRSPPSDPSYQRSRTQEVNRKPIFPLHHDKASPPTVAGNPLQDIRPSDPSGSIPGQHPQESVSNMRHEVHEAKQVSASGGGGIGASGNQQPQEGAADAMILAAGIQTNEDMASCMPSTSGGRGVLQAGAGGRMQQVGMSEHEELVRNLHNIIEDLIRDLPVDVQRHYQGRVQNVFRQARCRRLLEAASALADPLRIPPAPDPPTHPPFPPAPPI